MSLPLTSITVRVSSNHAFPPLTKGECPCRTPPSTVDNLVAADDVFVAVSPVRVDGVGPRARQPADQRCLAGNLRFADDTERSRAVSSVPDTCADAAAGSLSPLSRSIGVALAAIGDRCQQERHGCRRQVILKGMHA